MRLQIPEGARAEVRTHRTVQQAERVGAGTWQDGLRCFVRTHAWVHVHQQQPLVPWLMPMVTFEVSTGRMVGSAQ
eukprot:2091666-Alexandrium_andersonii.AAC.1